MEGVSYPVILGFPDRESRSISIPASPVMVWILLDEGTSLQICAIKSDFQLIIPLLLQIRRYIHPLRSEHVLCFQNFLAIENDSCIRVEAIESQNGLHVRPF